jgi:hypothetical protein
VALSTSIPKVTSRVATAKSVKTPVKAKAEAPAKLLSAIKVTMSEGTQELSGIYRRPLPVKATPKPAAPKPAPTKPALAQAPAKTTKPVAQKPVVPKSVAGAAGPATKKEGLGASPANPVRNDPVTPPGPSPKDSAGVVAGSGEVTVAINASESWYENKIYWSTDNFATKHYLGVDNQAGTVRLGTFAEGTKIEFGIDNGQGSFFRTGAANDNVDGLAHARVDRSGNDTRIGFEDLNGGGDRDYNDAIISVHTSPASAPPEVKTPEPPVESKPTSPEINPNRSGLGDGTNPGQGAGQANSPNEGTRNPHKAS